MQHPLDRALLPSLILLLLAAAGPPAAGQAAEARGFPVLDEAGGALQIGFGHEQWLPLYEQFVRREPLRLRDFPLPGGASVTLELRPVFAMEPGGHVQVVDADEVFEIQPTVATFSGRVVGRPSTVFLGISPDLLHGYVRVGGELYLISSGSGSGTAFVTAAGSLPGPTAAPTTCGTLASPAGPGAPGGSGSAPRGSGPVLRTADLFVEGDHTFRAAFATEQEAADYALLLFAASADIYRRDFGAVPRIPSGYLRIWNVEPPFGTWGSTNSLPSYRNWWDSPDNPDQFLPRAAVHLLTVPIFGGIAYTNGLCDNSAGYGVSGLNGFFPHPVQHTSNANWDLYIVSHEVGHNFGADHTDSYMPPIPCVDSSGPDEGTLMSYCHQNPGGMSNVGMRFHPVVQEDVRTFLDSAACVQFAPIALGDYDGDGSHTEADLAAFSACVDQGFESAGCLETFDMNGDQVLDDCDRLALQNLVYGYPLTLSQGPLQRGQTASFTVTGAAAGERVYYLYSFNGTGCGPCPGKIGGLCLDLRTPLTLFGQKTADGAGTAVLNGPVPPTAPLVDISTQAVVRRGPGGADSVKSNPVTAPILP